MASSTARAKKMASERISQHAQLSLRKTVVSHLNYFVYVTSLCRPVCNQDSTPGVLGSLFNVGRSFVAFLIDHAFIYLFIYLFTYLLIYVSICLSTHLLVFSYLFIHIYFLVLLFKCFFIL